MVDNIHYGAAYRERKKQLACSDSTQEAASILLPRKQRYKINVRCPAIHECGQIPQNGGTYPSIDDYIAIETIGVAPYPERTVPKILLSISVTTLPVHIKTYQNTYEYLH